MEIVLLIARLLLVVIFGVAGIAKLADREGARRALSAFGVPEAITPALVWGLPIIEIKIALSLFLLQTAWLGAIGAATLLLIFLVGIGVNLAQGNTPDCHCFGHLHSEPVSWAVFVRNVGLAAVAVFIIVLGKDNPGLSALSWLSYLGAGEIVSLILSVFVAGILIPMFILLRRILKQLTTLLETVTTMKKVIDDDYAELAPVEREAAVPPNEGLPIGVSAPRFSLPSLSGDKVSLDDLLRAANPVFLFFVSPNCFPCKTLLPVIRSWERDYADLVTIGVLSKGTEQENQAKMTKYGIKHLLLLGDSKLVEEYQARWTPAVVLINEEKKIASQMTFGNRQIRELVEQVITSVESRQGALAVRKTNGHKPQFVQKYSVLKIGELPPIFSLPDLSGRVIDIKDLLGKETLLLFWNPQCPTCEGMFDALKKWEAHPPKDAPNLVFIATGSEQEIRKMKEEVQSMILIDQDMDVGPLFGFKGTPSAILIDRNGRVASSMAASVQNILVLAGVQEVAVNGENLLLAEIKG